jgi:hypothetical protein
MLLRDGQKSRTNRYKLLNFQQLHAFGKSLQVSENSKDEIVAKRACTQPGGRADDFPIRSLHPTPASHRCK